MLPAWETQLCLPFSQSLKIDTILVIFCNVFFKCNANEQNQCCLSRKKLCLYAFSRHIKSCPAAIPRWPLKWLALKGLCFRKQTLSPVKVKYILIATSSTDSTLLPQGYRIWCKQTGCVRASYIYASVILLYCITLHSNDLKSLRWALVRDSYFYISNLLQWVLTSSH